MTSTNNNKKLIRITTVPMALRYLLPGQMKFMQQNGFNVIMISADGPELNDVIKNEACRHIVVPMTRKITPWQDLKCLIRLIKIFRKEKPDIVHTHTPKAGLLGMMAAKFAGVKVRIHTVAGMPLMVEKGAKLKLLKFIEKLTYSAAGHVWPNSYSLYQYITDHQFTSKQKLSIIGKGSTNGININRFSTAALDENIIKQVKDSINYSPENIYLLCIGRLVADKGIVELVNVFIALQKKHATLKLILVGDFEGELDPLPATVLEQIQTNNNIIHIKWTQQVEYFMHIADYFVFPSHREGFPNVLLQAGAMQLPVICSRIAGNVDIVSDKQTGLIFETANEQQMEELIEFAISNPAVMQTMSAALVEIIKKDFQRENIWQNILSTYKSLLHLNN
ncbi:glycosyltransferase family 4 protein [Ferruginibacter sp. SUN106]|uniref:glycosyltransferase family 4 protein n=1 Tax=Ferruginibacter sp. SUN106 TaxID=2978348 RepID=UPI003D359D10